MSGLDCGDATWKEAHSWACNCAMAYQVRPLISLFAGVFPAAHPIRSTTVRKLSTDRPPSDRRSLPLERGDNPGMGWGFDPEDTMREYYRCDYHTPVSDRRRNGHETTIRGRAI